MSASAAVVKVTIKTCSGSLLSKLVVLPEQRRVCFFLLVEAVGAATRFIADRVRPDCPATAADEVTRDAPWP